MAAKHLRGCRREHAREEQNTYEVNTYEVNTYEGNTYEVNTSTWGEEAPEMPETPLTLNPTPYTLNPNLGRGGYQRCLNSAQNR